MTNIRIILAFLIAISFSISTFAKDEAKAIHNELFASKNLLSKIRKQTSNPDRTHALLLQLSSMYKEKRDVETLKESVKVETLIETRKLSPEKCNFYEIYRQTIIHSKATLNIIPYLTDNIERLFNFCKDSLYNKLNLALSTFSDQENDDMEKIRLYVLYGGYKVKRPLYYISPGAIEDGLVNFLKDRVKGTSEVLLDYDTIIGNLCEKVVHRLFEPLGTFELIFEEGKRSFLDERTTSWLVNMEICKSVLESRPELGQVVETRLKEVKNTSNDK